MAEIVGKQLMEKASLRCAKYCKALDDPTRASLCLERGFNHENKEMRSMVQELSGTITERAYDLGFPTFIKSSYETENWWSSVVIDTTQIQISFISTYATLVEEVQADEKGKEFLQSLKGDIFMIFFGEILGKRFPKLSRHNLLVTFQTIWHGIRNLKTIDDVRNV